MLGTQKKARRLFFDGGLYNSPGQQSTLHYGPPSNDPAGVTVRFMVRLVSVLRVVIRRNITK